MTERMTWEEIIRQYPHQHIGLVDIHDEPNGSISAIVKYTEQDLSRGEMIEKATKGEIHLRYTSPEDFPDIATPFLSSDFIE